MSRMKNSNIKKYAELAVKGNKHRNSADWVTFALKIVYCIVAAAAIVTCLTMMIGNLVWMGEYKEAANASELAKYNENRNQFITMAAAVFCLVASYFLMHFKQAILFALTGCVDCIIIFTTLYSVSVTNDIANGGMQNFWIMAVPSIICAVCAVALGVLLFVTYRLRIPKAYDKIINDLYQSHTQNGENPLSAEEFEEICDDYRGEEIFRTDIPLKKSVKRRKEKQDKQEEQEKQA